eukprot:m51a1_g9647 putative C-tail anchored protein (425) ;mRNA; r:1172130-1174507
MRVSVPLVLAVVVATATRAIDVSIVSEGRSVKVVSNDITDPAFANASVAQPVDGTGAASPVVEMPGALGTASLPDHYIDTEFEVAISYRCSHTAPESMLQLTMTVPLGQWFEDEPGGTWIPTKNVTFSWAKKCSPALSHEGFYMKESGDDDWAVSEGVVRKPWIDGSKVVGPRTTKLVFTISSVSGSFSWGRPVTNAGTGVAVTLVGSGAVSGYLYPNDNLVSVDLTVLFDLCEKDEVVTLKIPLDGYDPAVVKFTKQCSKDAGQHSESGLIVVVQAAPDQRLTAIRDGQTFDLSKVAVGPHVSDVALLLASDARVVVRSIEVTQGVPYIYRHRLEAKFPLTVTTSATTVPLYFSCEKAGETATKVTVQSDGAKSLSFQFIKECAPRSSRATSESFMSSSGMFWSLLLAFCGGCVIFYYVERRR